MNKQNNAPLFHIVKRGALPWYQAWGIRAAAIVLALLFIVCFIIGLWVLMALTRIVLG